MAIYLCSSFAVECPMDGVHHELVVTQWHVLVYIKIMVKEGHHETDYVYI